MKLSAKQIAASASGAVASAVIASVFGEKGTIIGVALGSVVATTATALTVQSIERAHGAVKQVVVKVPSRLPLLGGSGTTGSAGTATSTVEGSPVTDGAGSGDQPSADEATPARTEAVAADVAAGAGTEAVAADVAAGAGTEAVAAAEPRLVSSSRVPGRPAAYPVLAGSPRRSRTRASGRAQSTLEAGRTGGGRVRWLALAVMVVAVFVVALLVVTGIELVAGRPLSSLIGTSSAKGGTSVGNVVAPSPSSVPTTAPVTTLPPVPSTTTSPPTSTTTTSTTAPTSSTSSTGSTSTTTTTTAPPSTSTAIAHLGGSG